MVGDAGGPTYNGQENSITYGYDTAGRLNSIVPNVSIDLSGNSLTSTAYSGLTYFPGGQVETASLAIDPTTGVPAISLSRSFDNRGRINGEIDENSSKQSAYSYSISYDGTNNVTGFTDSVAGSWTVKNDALHRFLSSSGTYDGKASAFLETYDHFGNRNVEYFTYNGVQNQPSAYLNFTPGRNRVATFSYDSAGNLLSDGTNNYLYDAENRICAVEQASGGAQVGYLYAPDGTRMGKGTITSTFSCDVTKNGMLTASGVALTTAYNVAPNGEVFEETDGNFNLKHFNLLWQGKLLGTFAGTTYSQSNWSFALNDWLGTKREIIKAGADSRSFFSGPFGDFLSQNGSGSDPSEEHFTGKERDIESSLDYFPARYYNSYLGRFMAPDWEGIPAPVPYGLLDNPQTLNLYSYVENNPLTNTDPDGHYVNICDASGQSCQTISDDQQYSQAQGQDSLNAPTLSQLQQSGGSMNITDANGNVVGTAQWGPNNPGVDGPENAAIFGQIGNQGMGAIRDFAAASAVGGVTGGLGLSALGSGAGLTTLGELDLVPQIGSKLDYLLGQATGSAYTVQRSLSMAAALSKIGLSDSPETRAYITEKITQAFNDPSSLEAGSSSVRDTLLMGPGGAVKMQTI
jgi:RHS repeat-associated protein